MANNNNNSDNNNNIKDIHNNNNNDNNEYNLFIPANLSKDNGLRAVFLNIVILVFAI